MKTLAELRSPFLGAGFELNSSMYRPDHDWVGLANGLTWPHPDRSPFLGRIDDLGGTVISFPFMAFPWCFLEEMGFEILYGINKHSISCDEVTVPSSEPQKVFQFSEAGWKL